MKGHCLRAQKSKMARRSGPPRRFPSAMERPDGTRITVLVNIVRLRHGDGELPNDSYNQMRTLTARLMLAQDDERRRIAQMLHETTARGSA